MLRLGVGGGEEENSRGGFDSLARKQEVEGRAGSGSRGPGFGPGVLVPDTWASSISDLRMFTCGIKVWLSISREATGLPPKSLRGFFKQYFFPTFLQLVESPGHKDSRPGGEQEASSLRWEDGCEPSSRVSSETFSLV